VSEVYPKMGTLFALEAAPNGKWWSAQDKLLPDTAGLFFIPPEDRIVTEKIDGSNCWYHVLGDEIDKVGKRNGVCSTDDRGDAFYFDVQPAIPDGFNHFGASILFGELVGPKVQSSGQLYKERQFVLFDVLSNEGKFFRWEAVKAVAAELAVEHVPVIEGPKAWSFDGVREYVIALHSALDPNAKAEGIVVRDSQDTSPLRRRIAKIRRKDFRSPSHPVGLQEEK
jgi:ATP-dependent RNA circularization protein (DNA/RNA ligase family)